MFPSGPAVMPPGWLAVGIRNSVIVMAGTISEEGADRLARARVLRQTLFDALAGIGDDAGRLDRLGALAVDVARFEPEELAGEDEFADVPAPVAQHAEDPQRAAQEPVPAPRRIALGEDGAVARDHLRAALGPDRVADDGRGHGDRVPGIGGKGGGTAERKHLRSHSHCSAPQAYSRGPVK